MSESEQQPLVSAIYAWRSRRNVSGPMPQPCPEGVEECAKWWEESVMANNSPWGDAQAREMVSRHALLSWLDLGREERQAVIAGVLDGVPYRGEKIELYMRIWDETVKMREEGVEEYRQKALAMREAMIGN